MSKGVCIRENSSESCSHSFSKVTKHMIKSCFDIEIRIPLFYIACLLTKKTRTTAKRCYLRCLLIHLLKLQCCQEDDAKYPSIYQKWWKYWSHSTSILCQCREAAGIHLCKTGVAGSILESRQTGEITGPVFCHDIWTYKHVVYRNS